MFGRPLPAEQWAWKFEQNPDGAFGIVATRDGRVVGNYAGWGVRFLLDQEPVLLYSVGDVATDPAVRSLGGRRGVYRAMAERFYESIAGRVPFCFGFPNPRALAISHRLIGSRTLFPIRYVLADCGSFPAPPRARTGDSVDDSFDWLWSSAARFLTHAPVRDRARVNWRFHARPDRYYRMVWLEQERGASAWGVLSVEGENALLADFLACEPGREALAPLLAACAAEAIRMGARRLVVWDPPGGPWRDALAAIPGERREAGYPMIVRVDQEEPLIRFASRLHLVPSLYDLV